MFCIRDEGGQTGQTLLPGVSYPTRRALSLSVRMIRDIFMRWIIASLKKTRSIPAPLTVSLYCIMNCSSLS